MTAKIMTGKQVNFLKELVNTKLVEIGQWRTILKEAGVEITEEEDLYHLNVEQASKLIGALIKMPNK